MNEVLFNSLYTAYAEDIKRFVQSRVTSPEVAEDITQEVFITLATHEVDTSQNVKAWLLKVAKNKAIDYFRSKIARENALPEVYEYGDVVLPDIADRIATLVDIQQALSKLSPLRRKVLLLHFVGDYRYAEIAEMSGRHSKHMAHFHVVRAKKEFIRVYEEVS